MKISCSYYRHFDTWEDAHNYLISKYKAELISTHLKIDRLNDTLSKINEMKKPEDKL